MPIQINGTLNTITGITAPIGFGGATGTGNVTLTAGSASNQLLTCTADGQTVTLPDATTISRGAGLFTISNRGDFTYRLMNSAGTPLSYIPPKQQVSVSLAGNATAAGDWNVLNPFYIGYDGSATRNLPSGNYPGTAQIVQLTSTTELIVFSAILGTPAVFAMVYDLSTQTFGTIATVRTANVGGYIQAIKVTNTTALVVTCTNGSTALEAVILSISGTTITVGTPSTATLASNAAASFDTTTSQLVLNGDGTAAVLTYARATSLLGVRAISISGTTVSIGSEVAQTGNACYGLYNLGGNQFLAISRNSGLTASYFTPYTVSGNTLTKGTEATPTLSGGDDIGTFQFASGRVGAVWAGSTTWSVGVVTVSGNVATVSVASTAAKATYTNFNGVAPFGNSALVVFANSTGNQYFNVFTDNAGTAVAGTAITKVTTTNVFPVIAMVDTTNSKAVVALGGRSYDVAIWELSISGGNPVIEKEYFVYAGGTYSLITNNIGIGRNGMYNDSARQLTSFVRGISNFSKGAVFIPFTGASVLISPNVYMYNLTPTATSTSIWFENTDPSNFPYFAPRYNLNMNCVYMFDAATLTNGGSQIFTISRVGMV